MTQDYTRLFNPVRPPTTPGSSWFYQAIRPARPEPIRIKKYSKLSKDINIKEHNAPRTNCPILISKKIQKNPKVSQGILYFELGMSGCHVVEKMPTPQPELLLQLLGEKLRHQQIQAAKVALVVTGVQALVYQCICYYYS